MLCITATRAFHSSCNASDTFSQERSQTTRDFCKKSLKLLSSAFTFTVSITSWRKPALSKDNSKLYSVSWKNDCRYLVLEEVTLDRGPCAAQALACSPSPGQTDPQGWLLLGPCCPPELPFAVRCLQAVNPFLT